jgi:hypothetical protein
MARIEGAEVTSALHNTASYRTMPYYSGYLKRWFGVKRTWSLRKRVTFCIYWGKP